MRVRSRSRHFPYKSLIRLDFSNVTLSRQGVGQFERVGEGFLGKGIVATNSEHLDVQALELAVVSLPGRQVRRSRGSEIRPIELDEHELLPLELAQADFVPCRAE